MSADGILKDALSTCVKCGACQAVCPVYDILKTERSVARGKIALIEALSKSELELSDSLYSALSQCILCTSCRETCSANVEIERIIAGAREIALNKRGMPPLKKAVLKILSAKTSSKNPAFKTAGLLQKLLLKKIPTTSGLLYRGIFLPGEEKLIPEIAEKPFHQRFENHDSDKAQSARSVMFFQGCTINYIYPHIGEAAVSIIRKGGFSPVVLPEQFCCGLPSYFSGDKETALSLATSNLELFSKYNLEYIVVACASCGAAFKNIYPILFEKNLEMKSRWEKFKGRVIDISQFTDGPGGKKLTELLNENNGKKLKVTYHDPCHLKKSQGVVNEPRKIIRMLPNITLVEMEGSSDCCGFGGTFSLENEKLSSEINRRKTGKIMATGADMVLTGCPGCIMQINRGLARAGGKQSVKHWVELLDEATEP